MVQRTKIFVALQQWFGYMVNTAGTYYEGTGGV